MKSKEFITESTALELASGDTVALRTYGGQARGTLVVMQVTKDEWEAVKNQPANTEIGGYDVASAEMIVNDWLKDGATLVWKTAADWNKEARDLENWRFRDQIDVEPSIQDLRNKARTVNKASIKRAK